MRHKAKVAAGIAAASVLLIAACGSDNETSGGGEGDNPGEVSGTVTFWPYPLGGVKDASWWEPHIAKFNEEYPDVEIELQMQAFSGREESLVTAISGGTEPDVVYFNPDFIPKYVVEDLLLPLEDTRDDWDKFQDSALDAMSYEGTLYGAPQLVQVQTSICNSDVLAAASVACPTTWDELREIGPAVKEAGHYAVGYNGQVTLNHSFYKYLWQAGGEVLNEDMTEAAFNGPEGLKALEFIKEIVDNEWASREEIVTMPSIEQSEMGQGNIAYNGGSNLAGLRDVLDPEIIEVVPPMKEVEQVAAGSVGGWSIFNTSEAPEAAQAWVRYLSDAEFLNEFLPEAGYLSPRTDTADIYTDDPQLASGADYIEFLRVGVQHPQAREIIDIIKPHIQRVLLEGADPQEALDAAADEVNSIL